MGGGVHVIPKEILRSVRKIEIRTSKMVQDVFSGEYHSVFKGRGIEFAEAREYQPGDDVRSIDWNVTARMGHPYVKQFVEERELTVVLMVDVSSSGKFGSTGRSKAEIAAEICAVIAFSAIRNNDKVGLLIFSDKVEKFVPPKKGRQHVLRVIRELLCSPPTGRNTDIAAAMDYMGRVLRRRSVVFLVSDFLAQGYEKSMSIASRKHDLICLSMNDPREVDIPKVGRILLSDAETGERVLVDTRDPRARDRFKALASQRLSGRSKSLKSMNVDTVSFVFPDEPSAVGDPFYLNPLLMFFEERARRLR